jgi:hypothetical protein
MMRIASVCCAKGGSDAPCWQSGGIYASGQQPDWDALRNTSSQKKPNPNNTLTTIPQPRLAAMLGDAALKLVTESKACLNLDTVKPYK